MTSPSLSWARPRPDRRAAFGQIVLNEARLTRRQPASLAARARGGKTVRFVPSAPFDDRLLTGLPEVTRVEREGRHTVVTGTGELVNAVILALHTAGLTAREVQLDSSNLEDAFVKLTGNHPDQEGAAR